MGMKHDLSSRMESMERIINRVEEKMEGMESYLYKELDNLVEQPSLPNQVLVSGHAPHELQVHLLETVHHFIEELHLFIRNRNSISISACIGSVGKKHSGTSGGESKLIPTTDEVLRRRSQLDKLQKCVMSQAVPDYGNDKAMYFMFLRSEEKTPGGLTARSLSTSIYRSPYFDFSRPQNNYTSPPATFLCPDSYQSMYSQMLCGLCQNRQVLRVGSFFATSFIRAILFLEKYWSLLCEDIRTGTVDASVTDPSVREAVMKILKPDPNLADFIEAECTKDSWKGIITRVWPNAKYVTTTVTGTMSQYVPTLDYYSSSLPLISSNKVSKSEASDDDDDGMSHEHVLVFMRD
ncbi:indole-3-acetic acid-amido synthetase GH3.5 [Capsicum annuum]|uniref:indole-3-acetic acid-amido synthetase GH3.5 n=1 Tax=Capsicum annuum TaxID=4072 RepID=UPI001FB17F1B|nr:indole-3-acetic acid-amido synthetase GH3.5 [Capsicum annuum]